MPDMFLARIGLASTASREFGVSFLIFEPRPLHKSRRKEPIVPGYASENRKAKRVPLVRRDFQPHRKTVVDGRSKTRLRERVQSPKFIERGPVRD